MAKTSTERYKKFKAKLKENEKRYNLFKSNDSDQKRAERRKQHPKTESDIPRQRKLNRDCLRKYKLLNKAEILSKLKAQVYETVAEVVYTTPQALLKAVGKVKPHLPKSLRKRKAVIKKLASSSGIAIAKRNKVSNGGNQKLSPEVVKKYQSYYNVDSISRQTAGRKEFVISREGGKKKHLQKCHLLYSLKEVHALFLKENPSIKIGLSKFCSLQPVNVSSSMPRNVCCCQYHENIRLLCDCLSKEVPGFTSYSSEFVNNFVCNPESEECMLGKCSRCPNYLQSIKESSSQENPVNW